MQDPAATVLAAFRLDGGHQLVRLAKKAATSATAASACGEPWTQINVLADRPAIILAMEQPAHIKVSGALEGEFVITEERSANEFVITCDTFWQAMLGKDEREATEEEIAALEAEHGPFLPPDSEG